MNVNDIKMVGIDQGTSIEIRERVAFNKGVDSALNALKKDDLDEAVILSTCHRSEIYFFSESKSFEDIIDFYIRYFNLDDEFRKYFYCISGLKAVEHIFRVASGLESMVLGEDQILGQVKESLMTSQENGISGKILNKLFRDAISIGKKVRTETGLKNYSSSISHIAVKFVENVFEDLKGKNAFVIGTGEMGKIAIRGLILKGANVSVSNRTYSKVQKLKSEMPDIEIVPYLDKYEQIAKSDIVISATNAPHYTISYDKFYSVYNGKQICMVDIAMPRDIDPKIGGIHGVKLYSIDDLKRTAEENRKKQLNAIKNAEEIVLKGVSEFNNWFKAIKVEPHIKKINIYSDEICDREFDKLVNKLEKMTDKDRENIKISLKRVAEKMANVMIKHLKDDALVMDEISFCIDGSEVKT
ncbi:glutamyl-tRNA reductase [Thermoanaerobacterium saccharolyticum]|uniref:glutamyl-tRNA reductase n=1 Tax=Thermoanaerobacterium saccharolyticum TaxID=28896 RepID=UPI002FD96010